MHDPAAVCDNVHCYIHNEDEDGYLRCFECGHAWPTPADLLADDIRVVTAMNSHSGTAVPHAKTPEEVTVCPQCTHDL